MTDLSPSSSMTKPKKPGRPKKSGKSMRIEKQPKPEMIAVLQKFSISEQLQFRRYFRELPGVIESTWQENFRCLDLHEFQKHLIGEPLEHFLQKMRRHFSSACFRAEKLQDQLNILERSSIPSLPKVRKCEINWDGSAGENCAQWPLHALPKLICRLRSLELHMPVEVGFIEQFTKLHSLILHDHISAEALQAIWCACSSLWRVQLLANDRPTLTGISQCNTLKELTIPVLAFDSSCASEILELPKLLFLELQQKVEPRELAIEAMCLIIRERAQDMHIIQLNGRRLGTSEEWLAQLDLKRCIRLDGLMLIDCKFENQDFISLGILPKLRYSVFCQCNDLKNMQVLEFVRDCPELKQLYLVGCGQLTCKLLYDLCSEDKYTKNPLGLYLQDCEPLSLEFQQHSHLMPALELLEAPQEEYRMEHVQFLFHDSTEPKQ